MKARPKSPCSPCCPKRKVGCRAECEDWQEYEAEYTIFLNSRRQEKYNNNQVDMFRATGLSNARKRKGLK